LMCNSSADLSGKERAIGHRIASDALSTASETTLPEFCKTKKDFASR